MQRHSNSTKLYRTTLIDTHPATPGSQFAPCSDQCGATWLLGVMAEERHCCFPSKWCENGSSSSVIRWLMIFCFVSLNFILKFGICCEMVLYRVHEIGQYWLAGFLQSIFLLFPLCSFSCFSLSLLPSSPWPHPPLNPQQTGRALRLHCLSFLTPEWLGPAGSHCYTCCFIFFEHLHSIAKSQAGPCNLNALSWKMGGARVQRMLLGHLPSM